MFKFVQTRDGSPSVYVALDGVEPEDLSLPPKERLEPMHNLRGAFSETIYIYGICLETCLARGFTPRVLSLGLGLGYVEVLSAALFEKHGISELEAGGESFELIPELREWFAGWVLSSGNVPPDFLATYEAILERTAAETGVSADRIRARLVSMLSNQRWVLSGPLSAETVAQGKINGIFGAVCFDAFSSKTSPDLWTVEFLAKFYSVVSAPECVTSTYACTGALKRVLEQLQFSVEIRPGFAHKRASTFAVRG